MEDNSGPSTGMPSQSTVSATEILWQNEQKTVILLDIPASISFVQVPSGKQPSRFLRAPAAISSPYTICEPKTKKAREQARLRNRLDEQDEEIISLITAAMEEIHSCHVGKWCFPRRTMPEDSNEPDFTPLGLNISLLQNPNLFDDLFDLSTRDTPSLDISDVYSRLCVNNESDGISIAIQLGAYFPLASGMDHKYHIPPQSSFVNSKLETMECTVLAERCKEGLSPAFSLITLDPPWPNASAKRSSAYSQKQGLSTLFGLLRALPMENLLSADGLVGIWITNKAAVWQSILGPQGLFRAWGVELIEIWTWVKVTDNGEAVSPVDGSWRKPYETFLLGKRTPTQFSTVKRRIIAGVPAAHSQKPCLRSLIEPHLPSPYHALEIFARHLVAGWSSWGDEVLKYNWEGYWDSDPAS